MGYANKQQDYEKRKNQEGSYSVYNDMYRFLMKNYDWRQLENLSSAAIESLEKALAVEGEEYSLKGGNKTEPQELIKIAKNVIVNFINNKGQHGDTGNNLGHKHDNSIRNIARTISDLRW